MELQEKIKKRKDYIENSIRFEKRDYFNLKFLNNISTLLDVDAPFQVDSLEYAPERFSLSGTIDSYDRLQLLKIICRNLKNLRAGTLSKVTVKVRKELFTELQLN